jgi:4-diphosphocytidyl-2-C-methyl-D-erythritol kinase
MTTLTLRPPAKLNLGLAITGRRPDGFHDLTTIFQAIDIRDTLEMTVPGDAPDASWTGFTCGSSAQTGQNNLVVRAVKAVRAATGCTLPIAIRLMKSIPAAAGLGGASSDAAATVRGLNQLWNLGLSAGDQLAIAADLGSDVPFFLRGGCALGQGRGELLRPLPSADSWFVVVFPAEPLPGERKTATMFSALQRGDFGAGDDVMAQANRLDAGLPLDPTLLANAFARPLYNLAPPLERLRDALRHAGAKHVAITGSGPTHYTVVATEHEANGIARAFSSTYTGSATVYVCRSCSI